MIIKTFSILLLLCISLVTNAADTGITSDNFKKVFIPDNLGTVPANNNFADSSSEYCYKRSLESDNIIMFWSKEYGSDPSTNKDVTKRFDAMRTLNECERFYNFYVDKLKLVKKGQSVTDKYKIIFLVTGGGEKTAYGWGKDSVGVLWSPAVRINKFPYAVLAHELGHAFQYLVSCDYGNQFQGAANEMAAQYMLWQVYPDWMTFENYHLKSYLKKTHYAFLHQQNAYHSPYVFEYWSEKHGLDFYGKLLQAKRKGEDVVTTYQRITNTSQKEFNDEMFEAARRFVTWDIERIKEIAKLYINFHNSNLIQESDDWYRIPAESCPENYGYNAIPLSIPGRKTKIVLSFKGIAGQDGYRKINIKQAGWRYGFVTLLKSGKRVYSPVYTDSQATVKLKIPNDATHVWLVVSGAPTHHSKVNNQEELNSQWPYEIKLFGSELLEPKIE